jgi:hypothetical protein
MIIMINLVRANNYKNYINPNFSSENIGKSWITKFCNYLSISFAVPLYGNKVKAVITNYSQMFRVKYLHVEKLHDIKCPVTTRTRGICTVIINKIQDRTEQDMNRDF